MSRFCTSQKSVAVDTVGNIANCTPVNFRDFAGAIVTVPAGSSITALTWYHCREENGTYQALYDPAGVALTPSTVGAGKDYAIAAEIFPAAFIKIVGDAAGTVHLTLKT